MSKQRTPLSRPLPLGDFDVIVVPVGNPATAPLLLRLASAMTDAETGRIIALFVRLENDEEQNDLLGDIEGIVNEFQQHHHPVELLVRHSSTIARTILEVAREEKSELIIMGTSSADEHHPISRNVAAAAPCALMIAHQPGSFQRIIVPVDDSEHARIACRYGLRLAKFFDVSMTVVGTQRPGHATSEIHSQLDRALRNLPGTQTTRRIIVPADDPLEGLFSEVAQGDMIILGFAHHAMLDKWLFSDFSRPLLTQAVGPVILTTRAEIGHDTVMAQLRRRWNWLMPVLTDDEQEELVWTAEEQAGPSLDYWVLMALGAIIATAGLLLNSATLIIGAMLVAPLRAPIMAFATGLTTGRTRTIRRALPTLGLGVLVAFVVAFLMGKLVVFKTPTAEMQAWSHPTLVDVAVALAAGFIGAYAAARKHISDALAGVAISASLEPAACALGLAVGVRNAELALGAGLLFLTNFVCISLAAWAAFFWMGMRPRVIERSRKQQYISVAVIMVLALPLIAALLILSNRQGVEGLIEERLQEAFLPAELVEVDVMDGETVMVLATVRSIEPVTPTLVSSIEDRLVSDVGKPVDLNVVALAIITDDPETSP
jgi:uncharacterized hydrophobic protein (TIGR00271 family)